MEKLEVLVIDEISMVRADMLDAIDGSLRLNRNKPDAPFGGRPGRLFRRFASTSAGGA